MTNLVVQKFGGSVLTCEDDYTRAARHVKSTVEQGRRVIAVVSALKGVTNDLLARSRRVHHDPPSNALDLLLATGELQSAALLSMALARLDVNGEALNPWQLGLHTDARHGGARIVRINPLPLQAKLLERSVVIVPGFLGRGEDHRLTTLGRGGSDLTAVALADVLEAQSCEFFKDVPGYFSADPHLLPEALHRPRVSGEEALELSRFGCRFLQDQAILWAMKSRCRVLLRALEEEERATRLSSERDGDHPLAVALTHCVVPDDFPDRIPSGLGAPAVLLSLVGRSLGERKEGTARINEALTKARVPSSLVDRSQCRLTFAVPAPDRVRAQRVLHDLILESEHQRIARNS